MISQNDPLNSQNYIKNKIRETPTVPDILYINSKWVVWTSYVNHKKYPILFVALPPTLNLFEIQSKRKLQQNTSLYVIGLWIFIKIDLLTLAAYHLTIRVWPRIYISFGQ